MKTKHFLTALSLLALTGMVNAQEKTENNWFIQGQLGASYSLGSADFGKLVSPSAAISVGKYFCPKVGARLSFSGWNGKASAVNSDLAHSFYYGAATVDGLFNLFNLFAGDDNERPFNMVAIAGIGYNRGFDSGVKSPGNINSFMARLGLQANVRLNAAFDLNLEATANGVSDRWNGKDDHSFDSYYNLLAGITYRFGSGFKVKCPSCDQPAPTKRMMYDEAYVQSLNDKINELRSALDNRKPCPEADTIRVRESAVPTAKSHVSFKLAKSNVEEDQQINIMAIADYMQQYPNAKATITGYADAKTGTPKINAALAAQRVRAVANELSKRYGISADRLITESHGSEIQPFKSNDLNRVVIMIAE
ncbi:MAG: OmpA family protein [Bacteroides sp.]